MRDRNADKTGDDRAMSRLVDNYIAPRGIRDTNLLNAMRRVPRDRFVPAEYRDIAHLDCALPIGQEQTISQPYIVALMIDNLGVKPGDKVLEIGTGSGYQAAVLAEMGLEVYTVEVLSELAQRARKSLDEAGYKAVHTRIGNGYYGWDKHGPYRGIIVAAATGAVPPPLLRQLDDGGNLVIPLGPEDGVQLLWRITRRGHRTERKPIADVRFVPFLQPHPGDTQVDPPDNGDG